MTIRQEVVAGIIAGTIVAIAKIIEREEEGSSSKGPPLSPGLPPDAVWLSPEEELILKVTPLDHWETTQHLASAAGLPNDRDFAAILRNLCRRNILESLSGRGFRRRQGGASPQKKLRKPSKKIILPQSEILNSFEGAAS